MYKVIPTAALLLAFAAPAMAQMRPTADALFEKADANKDALVSREEFLAARAQQFNRADRNGDDFIDDSDAPKRMLARKELADRIAILRTQFDANGDGKISKEEFLNGPTSVFDRADADHNGTLDSKELAAAKESAKAQASALRKS
jgi:Ca2+-binding EF-hand superfamily protein